jgi:hypothetical protein
MYIHDGKRAYEAAKLQNFQWSQALKKVWSNKTLLKSITDSQTNQKPTDNNWNRLVYQSTDHLLLILIETHRINQINTS